MPRYFFTIHRQDRVVDDPDGTYLPDAAAALSYAEYTIRELRKKTGYKDDLALMMMVKDQAGRTSNSFSLLTTSADASATSSPAPSASCASRVI